MRFNANVKVIGTGDYVSKKDGKKHYVADFRFEDGDIKQADLAPEVVGKVVEDDRINGVFTCRAGVSQKTGNAYCILSLESIIDF